MILALFILLGSEEKEMWCKRKRSYTHTHTGDVIAYMMMTTHIIHALYLGGREGV